MPTVSALLEIPQTLPFLAAVCWQTEDVKHFTPAEMLRRYEQGWKYRGVLGDPNAEELCFVRELAQRYGSWLATEGQMFDLEFHQKILRVLRNLDAEFFQANQIYFGGGTLVSLTHGEYRLSKDIDFLCPVGDSYRFLRQAVAETGFKALFTTQKGMTLPGDLHANRYGVRFAVTVDQVPIKFEIVAEERISLGQPDYPAWCPVPCLNQVDTFAEKLLANSDRWADASIASRDLIDLSMLRLATPIPQAALEKAENAYAVIDPLVRAIQTFQTRPEYRERCYRALGIQVPERIVDGLDRLAEDFGFALTERTFTESQAEVDSDPQQTPSQLWQHYSKDIPAPIAGRKLTAIACRALQDDLHPKMITQMLLQAPHLEELQQRQGPKQAQEFARLIVRNAQVQSQRPQQSHPSQKRQQGQDLGPEL